MKSIRSIKELTSEIKELDSNKIPLAFLFKDYYLTEVLVSQINNIVCNDYNQVMSREELNKKINDLYMRMPNTRDEIIKEILFIPNIVIKMYFNDLCKDELLGFGIEGLVIALNEYDPSKQRDFISFAITKVIDGIITHFNDVVGQDFYSYVNDKVEVSSLDNEINETTTIEEYNYPKELEENIKALLDDLSPLERDIVHYKYGFVDGTCYENADIARILGCSLVAVRNGSERIFRKLRNPKYHHLVEDYVDDFYNLRISYSPEEILLRGLNRVKRSDVNVLYVMEMLKNRFHRATMEQALYLIELLDKIDNIVIDGLRNNKNFGTIKTDIIGETGVSLTIEFISSIAYKVRDKVNKNKSF